jgi:type I restriction enzyme S subunit
MNSASSVDLVPLGSVTVKIGSGATPRGGKEAYQGGGISLIRSMNVYDNWFNRRQLASIDKQQADALRSVEVQSGDVLLNISGASVARCCTVPADVLPARVNQHVAIIRVDPLRAEGKYVEYLLTSPTGKHQLLALAQGGATREALTKRTLERLPVRLPPLDAQRRIAGFLGAYDELIENNARRIQILEEMAKAIYREWFVEFRYPGHEDVPLVDSDLGRMPEGWNLVRTSDLIDGGSLEIGDGYRAKNIEFGPEGLPFLRVKNLRDAFEFGDVDLLPLEALSRVGRKRSRVGDAVITMKGTVGRFSFVTERTPEFVYSPQLSYWRVLDSGPLHALYLRGWMAGPEFERQCAIVKGSTDMADYVNLKDQRQMRIVLPPPRLQEQFASVVEPIFELEMRLRDARENLRATRDLLLPRLISGEIDVSDLDIDVGDAAA